MKKIDRDANLKHNAKILENFVAKQESPFSPEGYLEGQFLLKDLKYGLQSFSYNGCGAAAVMNVLRSLGVTLNLARIIYDLEPGLLLQGTLGTEVYFIKNYLMNLDQHYKVKLFYNKQAFKNAKCDQGILYFTMPNLRAHYTAFDFVGINSKGERLYKFHNNASLSVYKRIGSIKYIEPPTMTIDEFLTKTKAKITVFYDVRK